MNVLYLTHLYRPTVGGVQRSVHTLAGLMIERGHRVVVASHGERPFSVGREGPPALRLRIPSPFGRGAGAAAERALWDPLNVAALATWSVRHRIQIVHAHLINVDTRYALILARLLRVKLIVTLRGGETEHWLDSNAHRSRYVCRILRRADHVTAVAGSLLDSAATLDSSIRARSTMIPNPMDRGRLVRSAPPAARSQGGRPYAVYVGRLEEMKDVGTLIEAFHRAAASEPSFRLDLRLVGSGSLLDTLRKMASSGPAPDRIHFLGTRPHGDCLGLIRDAEALVLPSRASEGCWRPWRSRRRSSCPTFRR